MLHKPPFEGTMKVRNKGEDVILLADAGTVSAAMEASRTLAVCGISTAVLEETARPEIDVRTLGYYEQVTRRMIAMNQAVMNVVSPFIQEDTVLCLFDGGSVTNMVRRMIRKIP